MTKLRIQLLLSLLLPILALTTAGCAGIGQSGQAGLTPASAKPQTEFALAPESILPSFVQKASPQVKEAYRFAIANPEVLKKIPCYCGCGKMGHQNNLQCYLKELKPDGSIAFDNHANGCTTCVDITQDVMRLMHQGKDLKSIRAYIDQNYSQYGPSTNIEPVQ